MPQKRSRRRAPFRAQTNDARHRVLSATPSTSQRLSRQAGTHSEGARQSARGALPASPVAPRRCLPVEPNLALRDKASNGAADLDQRRSRLLRNIASRHPAPNPSQEQDEFEVEFLSTRAAPRIHPHRLRGGAGRRSGCFSNRCPLRGTELHELLNAQIRSRTELANGHATYKTLQHGLFHLRNVERCSHACRGKTIVRHNPRAERFSGATRPHGGRQARRCSSPLAVELASTNNDAPCLVGASPRFTRTVRHSSDPTRSADSLSSRRENFGGRSDGLSRPAVAP